MEIKYYGGNCVKIITKKNSIIVDDLVNTENKSIATDKDIVLRTYMSDSVPKAHFLINGPGEYEVSEVSISGVASRAHMDEEGKHTATMYRLHLDGYRIAIVGHIYPEISEDQLEALGTVDILIIPVGGNGYTLDGIGAQKIVRAIEPKIVIPTHYQDTKTKYELPQFDLESALKALAIEPVESIESLKLKSSEFTNETPKLIVIEPN